VPQKSCKWRRRIESHTGGHASDESQADKALRCPSLPGATVTRITDLSAQITVTDPTQLKPQLLLSLAF
jgi:hypothetical protein